MIYKIDFIEEPVDLLESEMSKIYGGNSGGFCFIFSTCGCKCPTPTCYEANNSKEKKSNSSNDKHKGKNSKKTKFSLINNQESMLCFIVTRHFN